VAQLHDRYMMMMMSFQEEWDDVECGAYKGEENYMCELDGENWVKEGEKCFLKFVGLEGKIILKWIFKK